MNNEGVRYMEQLLIIEDDIGLNQGLSKALKADDRQIISCHDLKAYRHAPVRRCAGLSARQQGYYNVTLNVWADNVNARKFYEKIGLRVQKIGMEKIL